MVQNPGMAQQMVNLQQSAAQATPEQREKLASLKADPELKLIFDDIEQNGPSASLSPSCDAVLAQQLHEKERLRATDIQRLGVFFFF